MDHISSMTTNKLKIGENGLEIRNFETGDGLL